jgi:hypothetical protein
LREKMGEDEREISGGWFSGLGEEAGKDGLCVGGVFGCVTGKEKWNCGLGVFFSKGGSGGLEKMS